MEMALDIFEISVANAGKSFLREGLVEDPFSKNDVGFFGRTDVGITVSDVNDAVEGGFQSLQDQAFAGPASVALRVPLGELDGESLPVVETGYIGEERDVSQAFLFEHEVNVEIKSV